MKNSFKKDILIILILFIAIAGIILPKELNDLDEIWNYNFARCIANGLLPYKDFNMVQTPLLPIICGIILKVVANELIVMRILAVIMMTAILYLIYKIFNLLKIHQYIINILIIGIYLLLYRYFCIDYNFAVLLILLVSIYLELKSLLKDNNILTVNYKKDFLLGILVGTSIIFKQTTGMFFSVIFIFYKLLLVDNKEKFSNACKIILMRLLGVTIPIVLFAIYLSVNNIWEDFLNYTIYSLNTFSNKISYKYLIKGSYGSVIATLSILVPITIIVTYIVSICKKIVTKEQSILFILFAYSVASLIIIYPISDGIHFLIGSMPSIILMLFIAWIVLNKLIKNKKVRYGIKYFFKAFSFILIFVILAYESFALLKYIKNCNQYKEIEHFKYIPGSYENIQKIDEFILEQNEQNKNIYILDATAAVYMIPINKYNKDYDLFLKGNLGAQGEDGQIEKLKNENEKTVVLIMKENHKRNWQNPEKVREYIINNWTKIGEIENFDIYEK